MENSGVLISCRMSHRERQNEGWGAGDGARWQNDAVEAARGLEWHLGVSFGSVMC